MGLSKIDFVKSGSYLREDFVLSLGITTGWALTTFLDSSFFAFSLAILLICSMVAFADTPGLKAGTAGVTCLETGFAAGAAGLAVCAAGLAACTAGLATGLATTTVFFVAGACLAAGFFATDLVVLLVGRAAFFIGFTVRFAAFFATGFVTFFACFAAGFFAAGLAAFLAGFAGFFLVAMLILF
jgi:hypothetical protein